MIELTNLRCEFDKRVILENVSIKIKNHLSVLGANGSGKSTLAKAICGLVPYEGEIKLNTHDIETLSLKEKAKTISYIPAKLEIYDNFIRVEEFVLLGRFPYKKSFFDYGENDKKIVKEKKKLRSDKYIGKLYSKNEIASACIIVVESSSTPYS